MKKLFVRLAAALALCTTAVCATAAVYADLRIINRSTGETLPIYRHQGQLWVAGKPGDRYAIQVSNRSGGRLLGVVSVDGVNVVSGDTAATNQRGYVLSPGGSVDIAGWRKSDQEVAAFYFTALDNSYAARTRRPDNVGVIGIAAFREYQPPVVMNEMAADAAPVAQRSAAPVAPMVKEESRLGTGHGERIHAPVQSVEFQRASSTPDEIITVRYDSYANLVARGIIPAPRRLPVPNAFPGNYVPDPS